nr:unnamed protein product [Callosobruchus analis]
MSKDNGLSLRISTQLPADHYRGYTYHTSFDDGASSTVVFFRGPLAPVLQVNSIQNSSPDRKTLASDNVEPKASHNDFEDNMPVALNGQHPHLKHTAFVRSSLSLIANILEHPIQQNSIFHFFNQVPASTVRLQQPPMQTSQSAANQHFPPNYLQYSKNEQFPERRQDKLLNTDDTVVISGRLSEVTSEAPQTSTTSAPQKTSITEGFTTSQVSVNTTTKFNEKLKATNLSSTSSTMEHMTTTENLSDTTIAGFTEESSTTALLKDSDTSSSQTTRPEESHDAHTSDQSSTTIPSVSIMNKPGPANSTTTDVTSKDSESTTVGENDLENTTKMIIVVV